MGIAKQVKQDSAAGAARRAREEGHTVFVYQCRGAMSHSPTLSRPVQDVAEMIEGIESEGWQLDRMDSNIYDRNVTIIGLFRRTI